MKPLRVALFASGTGSNAMALIQKAKELQGRIDIAFVLSDRSHAPVLGKAQAAGLRTYLVERTSGVAKHEEQILNLVQEYRVDWILLAGYMRLLSSPFLKTLAHWHEGASQVVNIHPSLLPLYPGKDAIARAYQDRVVESGVTLHFVDEGMDTGPILKQARVPLTPGESLNAWSEQVHQIEHQVYGEFLEELAAGVIPTNTFKETS